VAEISSVLLIKMKMIMVFGGRRALRSIIRIEMLLPHLEEPE
jgi:hypothetical protein